MNASKGHTVMVSAHRSGAELDGSAENRRPTLIGSAEAAYEFVEFDVQRCKDGTFVLHHDNYVLINGQQRPIGAVDYAELTAAQGEIVTLNEALDILRGKSKAHVDLKFTSPPELYDDPASTYEVEATRLVIEKMGVANCIITTLEDPSVLTVRRWAEHRYPALLVGLSLGRSAEELSPTAALSLRLREIFAERRLRTCRANLIVANKQLAKIRLARLAQKMGLPLLVWTVDEEEELRAWLSDRRAWLVTTNFPRRALAIRESL